MSSVYKARAVTLDTENIVSIETPTYPAETVYESEAPSGQPPEVLAGNILSRAQSQADFVLQAATAEAERIIRFTAQTAEAEADEIKKNAQADGYRAGYLEGINKAEAEGQKIIAQAQIVLENAINERDAMRASHEPEAVRLIADIAHKLTWDIATLYPETIVCLIRQGFAGAALGDSIQVRISPADYELAAGHTEAIAALTDSAVKLTLVRDPSLEPMDCIIETPSGDIEVSLAMQAATLRDQLFYLLDTRNAPA